MTDRWAYETGLIFALLSIFLGYRFAPFFLAIAAGIILSLILTPSIIRPFASAWFLLADAVGKVMTRFFFGIVFFTLVVPAGLIHRILRGDRRDLELHHERGTELVDAAGVITASQLKKPY
jgi:hypothetical protein